MVMKIHLVWAASIPPKINLQDQNGPKRIVENTVFFQVEQHLLVARHNLNPRFKASSHVVCFLFLSNELTWTFIFKEHLDRSKWNIGMCLFNGYNDSTIKLGTIKSINHKSIVAFYSILPIGKSSVLTVALIEALNLVALWRGHVDALHPLVGRLAWWDPTWLSLCRKSNAKRVYLCLSNYSWSFGLSFNSFNLMKHHEVAPCHVLSLDSQHGVTWSIIRWAAQARHQHRLGNALKACCILANSSNVSKATYETTKRSKVFKSIQKSEVCLRHLGMYFILHRLNRCFLISSDNNNWFMLFRQVRVCLKGMFFPAKHIIGTLAQRSILESSFTKESWSAWTPKKCLGARATATS